MVYEVYRHPDRVRADVYDCMYQGSYPHSLACATHMRIKVFSILPQHGP